MILGFSQDSGTDATTQTLTTGGTGESPRIYATRAFIQLAGFTFGKATSYFDFVSSAAVAYQAGLPHRPIPATRAMWLLLTPLNSATACRVQSRSNKSVLAVSSISVPRSSAALTQGCTDLAGVNRLQDIVANFASIKPGVLLRSQSLRITTGLPTTATAPLRRGSYEWNGHPSNKWGGAVTFGLRLNFPMIGAGDYFQGQAVYAKGASQYASNTPGAFLAKQGDTFGINAVNDGGFTGTAAVPGIYELTTAWSVFASYEHFWTPSLRTSLYGSYVDYSRGDALNNALCASGLVAGGTAAGGRAAGCDLNSQYWVVGSRSQWNITKDLYMGFDVLYSKLNSATLNTAGTYTAAAGNGVAAGSFYKTGSLDAVSAAWRIHRDIVP